jgi:hypothetical protein
MRPYTEADLDQIDKDPVRCKAYFWRVAQKLKMSGDPWMTPLGDTILDNLDSFVDCRFDVSERE